MLNNLEIIPYRSWRYSVQQAALNFDCGHHHLNNYLIKHTDIEVNANKDNILLAVMNESIVGFISYRIHNIIPGSNTIMSNDDTYPYMVIEALAVHKNYQKNQIGMLMLSKVIEVTVQVNQFVNLHGIYLNAYYEAVNFYKNKFSFEVLNPYLLYDANLLYLLLIQALHNFIK